MWDNGAQAVAQAVKAAGRDPGTVWSTGSDGSPASLAYIWQGWQGQSTWTAVDQQATNAMNIAHAFASGQEPPKPDGQTDYWGTGSQHTSFVDHQGHTLRVRQYQRPQGVGCTAGRFRRRRRYGLWLTPNRRTAQCPP